MRTCVPLLTASKVLLFSFPAPGTDLTPGLDIERCSIAKPVKGSDRMKRR